MNSIKDIYIIGNGPSSSHTMGPSFAVDYILNKYELLNIKEIRVTLFGSLALTGKGHLTDKIILDKLKKYNPQIIFDYKKEVKHPNTLSFEIITFNNEKFIETIISTGGGSILINTNINSLNEEQIYKENTLNDILNYCKKINMSILDYILSHEDENIFDYIENVYEVMTDSIKRGISKDGFLPGKLNVKRKAKEIYESINLKNNLIMDKDNLIVIASSYAASEENASGGIVVTAPTCGSCGVIPGVISFLLSKRIKKRKILEGLLVAGLIGKIVKTNASISGAMCGCQAEIGVACAMGSALIMHAFSFSNEKIEQASEIALEHSLGLTCDPIQGYVQIPCIERNSIFALKAINSALLASSIDKSNSKINFDEIVTTMYETGIDLKTEYKETSLSGMSKINKFKL